MTRNALGKMESVAGSSQAFSPSNCKMTRLVLVNVTEGRLKCKAEHSSYSRPVKSPGTAAIRRGHVTLGMTQTSNNPSCKLAPGKTAKLPP